MSTATSQEFHLEPAPLRAGHAARAGAWPLWTIRTTGSTGVEAAESSFERFKAMPQTEYLRRALATVGQA